MYLIHLHSRPLAERQRQAAASGRRRREAGTTPSERAGAHQLTAIELHHLEVIGGLQLYQFAIVQLHEGVPGSDGALRLAYPNSASHKPHRLAFLIV